MSAYGSAAYGSLPVDSDSGTLTVGGTSAFEVTADSSFVVIPKPLSFLRTNTFGAGVLQFRRQRRLYPGEVYIFEEDFLDGVDRAGIRFSGPVRFVNLTGTDASTVTLGTNPATAQVVRRIHQFAAPPGTMTLSTAPAALHALNIDAQPSSVATSETAPDGTGAMRLTASPVRTRPVEANPTSVTFNITASPVRTRPVEAGTGSPLVVAPVGNQSANEGQTFA